MRRIVRAATIAGVCGISLCTTLAAQPPSPPAPRPTPKASQTPLKVSLPPLSASVVTSSATIPSSSAPPSAVKGKVQYGNGYAENRITSQGEIIMMQYAVWFRSPDAYLTTEKALYNRATKIASSPGKFNLKTDDADLTANTGTVYFNTRDAQARGSLVMIIRPRPQDANAPQGSARRQFDSPATITCEKGDYNWRSGKGILTGNLTVRQKNRTVTADKILIDTKNEVITLDQNVQWTTTDGDKGKAAKVILNYREGAEIPFKAINGVGVSNVDELDDSAPSPSNLPPAPAP